MVEPGVPVSSGAGASVVGGHHFLLAVTQALPRSRADNARIPRCALSARPGETAEALSCPPPPKPPPRPGRYAQVPCRPGLVPSTPTRPYCASAFYILPFVVQTDQLLKNTNLQTTSLSCIQLIKKVEWIPGTDQAGALCRISFPESPVT